LAANDVKGRGANNDDAVSGDVYLIHYWSWLALPSSGCLSDKAMHADMRTQKSLLPVDARAVGLTATGASEMADSGRRGNGKDGFEPSVPPVNELVSRRNRRRI